MVRIVEAPDDHFVVGGVRREYLSEQLYPKRDLAVVRAAADQLARDRVPKMIGLEIVVLPRTPAPYNGEDYGHTVALAFWLEPTKIFLLPRDVEQDASDLRDHVGGALLVATRVVAGYHPSPERQATLRRWRERWKQNAAAINPTSHIARTLKHEIGHLLHFARCRRRKLEPTAVFRWLTDRYGAICEQRAIASDILELPGARDPSEMVPEDATLLWPNALSLNKYTMVGDLLLPELVERGRHIVAERLLTPIVQAELASKHVSGEAKSLLQRVHNGELDPGIGKIAEHLARNEGLLRELAAPSSSAPKASPSSIKHKKMIGAKYASRGAALANGKRVARNQVVSRKTRAKGNTSSTARTKKVAKRKP